jgi:hypothetical protein
MLTWTRIHQIDLSRWPASAPSLNA